MSDQDWKCVPLTDLVDINPESLSNSTPAGSRFRYIDISSVQAGVIDWQTVLECSFATAPSRARRIVRPKDSLFCTVRPSLQAHAYAAWNDQDGYVCSTGFAVLRPSRSDPRFIFHKLFSEELARQVRQSEVGSSYPAVSEGELGRMFVSVPLTIEEQTRIAEILDTLDEAIREAEAVIAKLRQVKAGLLHDLLTRGLDEHGHLRDPIRHPDQFQDSPIGLIPKAWRTVPLSEPLSMIMDYRGRTPKKLGMDWGGEIPALSAKNVTLGGVDLARETNFGSEALYRRWMTHGDMEKDDVLLTLEAPLGNIAWVPDTQRYILSQRVVLLRPNRDVLDPVFLRYQLMEDRFQRKLVLHSTGTTATGIQRSKLERIPICIPASMDEQKSIAIILHSTDSRINAEQQTLAKLQCFKRGLSHDLLTGRKRVKT